jgi:hypothetical protein
LEVTDEIKKKDRQRTTAIIRQRKREREHQEAAVRKLPNEFRDSGRDYNPNNIYNGDSYCGLFAEDY